MLPLALNVPAIFAPVFVITTTFGVPTALMLTLLLATIVILLLPLTILDPAAMLILLNKPPSPKNTALPPELPPIVPNENRLPTLALPVELNVVANTPVVPKLATLALPDTDILVNVPVLVIFGCALVVTVPAVVADVADVADVALVAVPAFVAYVALATVPVTLAPGIDVRPVAAP